MPEPSASQTKIRIKPTKAGKPSLPSAIVVEGELAAVVWRAPEDQNCVHQVSDDEYRVRLRVSERFTAFRFANKAWRIHDHPPTGVDARHLLGVLLVAIDLAELEDIAQSRLPSRVLTDAERNLFHKGAGRPKDMRTLEAYRAIEGKFRFLGKVA